jgi:PAS domain S-box-containing protein
MLPKGRRAQTVYDAKNLVIQNRLLTEEVKRRVDQLAAINTVAATVSQSLDLNRTLETALQAVLDIVEAEAGGISLIDSESGEVVLRAQKGWIHDFVKQQPMRIPFGKGMSGKVITHDDVVVDNDLDGNEEIAVPSFRNEHFRSIVMAPMHARGQIIGILSIMSSKPNSFDKEIIDVLRAIADTVGVALDNSGLYEETLERENQLSAILHSTADGIIATDRNGRIRLINNAAETMFDVDARKLIGVPLREAAIHPRVRDSLLYALSSRTEETQRSFQVTLNNGRVLSLVVSPIYVDSQVEQGKETDGWVIVLQDVTHLREAEIARAQFIQAAAHDMRNPLSVAMSSLGLLRDILGSNQDTKEIIDIAFSGVNRLQDLIDDLLHLEHIESGYGFSMSENDIVTLITQLSIESRPMMEHKQITYTLEIDPAIPAMQIDRSWFSRALMNYLNNAAKYTQPGGKVTLKAFISGASLHIEVVDNGPGIPQEAQSRLFERFYRVPQTEYIRGTGLGLAIVKSVAEAHGGTVYVQSKQGQGSTFGMTLPLVLVQT